ncbi:MAG: LytTR family DNA-binding domain-containing protein [Bacteroidia bacterium]|nr:LytTR family DNA-binding domain-containing protein [Bacteroidia bacterium]
MNNYTCVILDDEPLALDVIEKYISKWEQFTVSGKYTDSLEAYPVIRTARPDLLFLDIEMPGLTGLELIETMPEKPEVIITTAYREYAVEGFALNVLDYLVKPIPFKRFAQAIDRFLEKKAREGKDSGEKRYIFVRADRKTVRIDLEDILYIEGVKDYVKIVMTDKKILTKESIGNFMAFLPSEKFLRVHKSFIVSRNKITAYTAHDIEIGRVEIPIGRMYKGVMKE